MISEQPVLTACELSEELNRVMARADPFEATELGIGGVEGLVPDMTLPGIAAHASRVRTITTLAGRLLEPTRPPDEAMALSCVVESGQSWLALSEARLPDHNVSPRDGLGRLLLVSAHTRIHSAADAASYEDRLRASAGYLDACSERLVAGAAQGRTPVAPVAAAVLDQIDDFLRASQDPFATVAAEPGVVDAAWRSRIDDLSSLSIKPAALRYREVLQSLRARGQDKCGLIHIPNGAADYAHLVRAHTTTDLEPDRIHGLGLAAVDELTTDFMLLAEEIGFKNFRDARDAVASSASHVDPAAQLVAAQQAVKRAEAALSGWFPAFDLPPCLVTAMPASVAATGMPPYYTGPDANRTGAYSFNTLVPVIGAGWDLEATAFHEAVPGHHLQNLRRRVVPALPALQADRNVTAHDEGWALYAEHLAYEMQLYSSSAQRLGAIAMALLRAARLVVDTGIHHRGWSRERALSYFRRTVPLPERAASIEVNRYIATPGQALGYHLGKSAIMELRTHARQTLGPSFDLKGFHAAVLDHGAVPLETLRLAVHRWVRAVATNAKD